jgi:rSAM/selenodomain-associated transferase 2/rSAM/selenodomain-associated transferase 1
MSKAPCERLIIFTRYPEPGKTKTRLIPALGARGAAELQRRMTQHTLAKARKLMDLRPAAIEIRYAGGSAALMRNWLGPQLDYASQHDGDIGRRMRLAFDEAFRSGTQAAVIIGTDIAGITVGTLAKAFEDLKENDVVIGPAGDGGYYLIGIQRACWAKAESRLFEGINWGTEHVFSKSLKIAKDSALRVGLLETLDDVDRPEDLRLLELAAGSPANGTTPKIISIIIPAFNEADTITGTLSPLAHRDGVEVIVVDGGSTDDTADLAASLGAKVMIASPSKAVQMNAGAAVAAGNVFLFLHADTQLPKKFEEAVIEGLQQTGAAAGAFQLRIDSDRRSLRWIERVANWRSRRLQAPYGDQAIFLTKALFQKIGGFADMPIMEDYELIRRLRKKGKIVILPESVRTSPRRWLNFGIFRTWLVNQLIICGFYLGIAPQRLADWYRRQKSNPR